MNWKTVYVQAFIIHLGLIRSDLACCLVENIYVSEIIISHKLNGRSRSRAYRIIFGSALVSLRWGEVQRLRTAASCTFSVKGTGKSPPAVGAVRCLKVIGF